ncbi:phosphoribosyltransferase domain-containing protein [Patescibacteria group bacterium]|nr:phosphoribosyltransferase domain-containing protein [Patescibacteria group bacterium]
MHATVSWEEVQQDAALLASKVRTADFTPDVLIGIASGGLVPLALLAREFPGAKVATIVAKSYQGTTQKEVEVGGLPDMDLSNKKVLLIDEIADHGITLMKVTEALNAKYQIGELKSAVLVKNNDRCIHCPDFYVRETNEWIQFPWEKEETAS